MKSFLKIIFSFILVLLIVLFSASIFESFLTRTVIEIKVTKLDRVMDEKGDLHYYIETPNEIFKNENNYYHGKSNQEPLMKLLEKDKTYKVQVVGYNLGFEIPFFISKRRNIIKIVQ